MKAKKDAEYFKALIEYAVTDTQRLTIETLVSTNGSARGAAKVLNKHHSVVIRSIKRVETHAASRGWAEAYNVSSLCPTAITLKALLLCLMERAALSSNGLRLTRTGQRV